MKLLDKNGANPKAKKSANYDFDGLPVRYATLSLMPNDKLCPMRHSAGCAEPCLVTSGMGGVYPTVNAARQAKTDFWMNDRAGFLSQLRAEMHAFIKLCKRQGKLPVFRLNTISDIPWERHLDLSGEFADAVFLDYTKIASRLGNVPSNYHLIFSYSAKIEFTKQVGVALKSDVPMSVVFRGKFPKYFMGKPVIDGDASDIVNAQKHGFIVGLKAKGKARNDVGNPFIVNTDNLIAVA
jgi:hypothetical protein